MNEERERALKRLLPTLDPVEAKRVYDLFYSGQPTGYGTVDRPWDCFYEGIEKNTQFLNTTPYQGLILGNKDHLDEDAIHYFGSNITFGELEASIDRISQSFEEHGVKKGDFVTICSTTNPEVVASFYALSKIGAAANVMSPFYTPEEFMYRINECESKLIIMSDHEGFMPRFKDALIQDKSKDVVILPMMNSSILRFFSKQYKVSGKTNEISWKTFLEDGRHREESLVDGYEPGKAQAMVYSSGSSGPAKGIVLSVDSFQKLINAYGNSGFDTSRGQKVYQNIPPWHSTGLSLGINFPLSYGVKVYTDPRFDHDVFIKNVLKFKPEYILTNTSMYQGFTFEKSLKRLRNKSLSFLKYPVEGGEPLTEKDVYNIETVFRNHGCMARLLNGYGQCECGATVTTDITSHKFSNNASGIPLPDITTVGIFDNNYRELMYGTRGHLLVKTEIGMNEYYKDPEKTKKFFYFDSNGDKWSKTGDMGYLNSDGSLVVEGRESDYSVIDGEKMFNFDIEKAILASHTVKLCEVQTHPEDDNQLVAHIVWENDISTLLKNHPERMNEYLSEIQERVEKLMKKSEAVPYLFCIWDSFPSAYSGKRDVKFIKHNIDGIIELEKPVTKKYIR